ncbi:MAG: hypothetical protein ACI8QZ_002060 [Chlamydiales bacterium]
MLASYDHVVEIARAPYLLSVNLVCVVGILELPPSTRKFTLQNTPDDTTATWRPMAREETLTEFAAWPSAC